MRRNTKIGATGGFDKPEMRMQFIFDLITNQSNAAQQFGGVGDSSFFEEGHSRGKAILTSIGSTLSLGCLRIGWG
jgi:hypothetical protein